MKKQLKSTVSLFLLFCLLATTIFPVCAEEAEAGEEPVRTEIIISSLDDFLEFTENCILDTYSVNKTVSLDTDLDLENTDFSGIPIFSGIFEGNNHTISGLSITIDGSNQGLFRYLTETAYVKNLTLQGKVLPEGSRQTVGGIAGSNAGTIENCCFQGEVSGNDYIGGLVGTNRVSGILEGCRVSGKIHGNHFVGGMAGDNYGLIRNCKNDSEINTTASENSVEISDISTDTITGTESADTVTDVGGIAGTSTGVIRNCENHGTVGYQHMGYNIGGIAGSQKGYITESKNYGEIYGRKEVAGIVGQMEPVSKIEYSADTLQILRQQLASTSALANQASSNVHNNAQDLTNQMTTLHNQAEVAIDAVTQLLPDKDNPHFPDKDSIQAAQNTLTSSMSSMQGTIRSLNDTTQAGVNTASNDIRAITNQLSAISSTLDNASETLGGTVTDVSDSDTVDDLTGKVSLCENFCTVSGDLNIGGIAGATAWENDLDPEDDFKIHGDQSMNFDSELRAVVIDCRNNALISAKKRNAGGIVGNQSLGLVKGCINTGSVEAENAEYVGGIVGTSSGFIRNCSAKCQLQGTNFVGGIAGTAPVVSDCRSMVFIQDGTEKLGSVIGIVSEKNTSLESPIFGNYYLPVFDNLGAIDGINYSGIADALTLEQFLNLENLPDIFKNAAITFQYEDGTVKKFTVPLGKVLDASNIPPVPEKDGFIGKWDNLEEVDFQNIFFDTILNPEYTPRRTVIQCEAVRENGMPILLAEGQFDALTHIDLTAMDALPTLPDELTAAEAWILPDFDTDKQTQLRLALPENMKPDSAKIIVQNSDGNWSKTSHTVNGSYLVFSVNPTDQAICLASASGTNHLEIYIIGGLILVLLLIVTTILVIKKRNKRKNKVSHKNQH